MPFVGLGLHIFVAIFFAVHAVRTGRELYWLIILFSFPLFGSIVYFLVVYLPHSRLDRGLRKATVTALKSLDPGRELRDAQHVFDLTPTAQNQMRLANACLENGDIPQAVQHFDRCLQGPFAADAEIGFGAARSKLEYNQAHAAVQLLKTIQQQSPTFRPEQVSLLLAQALDADGKKDEARNEFMAAVARFGSIESRAEYAIWAARVGEAETAERLHGELQHAQKHFTKHARSLHQPLLRRLDAALAQTRKSA